MAKNSNLTRAKNAKNDEFYTQASDIENELKYYKPHFNGKVVYCNCDDPTSSQFWRYFYRSFKYLGLKKLISTHYNMDGSSSYALIYEGGHDNADNFDEGVVKVPLKGNGDFRSDECVEYLKQSDVVVTNPPFSLARAYVKQLMDFNKDFLIVGNKNWITYKEIFPLLMNRQMWIGQNNVKQFQQPDGSIKKFGNVGWFTNMSLNKSTDQTVLWKKFNQDDYPAYDNYAAFEVSKVADIPVDTEIEAGIDSENLDGWKNTYGDDLVVLDDDGKVAKVKINRPVWGTPITMLDKYNPQSTVQQHNLAKDFEILGMSKGLGFNEINKIQTIKKYIHAIQWSQDAKQSNGSKLNTGANISYDTIPSKGKYYTADNAKGYLHQTYGRVLIRKKK